MLQNRSFVVVNITIIVDILRIMTSRKANRCHLLSGCPPLNGVAAMERKNNGRPVVAPVACGNVPLYLYIQTLPTYAGDLLRRAVDATRNRCGGYFDSLAAQCSAVLCVGAQ